MLRRTRADRRKTISILVDGEPIDVWQGDDLATALGLHGRMQLRNSPTGQTPRGAFCFMGVCQECAIYIDGTLRQACLTRAEPGMSVELRGAP